MQPGGHEGSLSKLDISYQVKEVDSWLWTHGFYDTQEEYTDKALAAVQLC